MTEPSVGDDVAFSRSASAVTKKAPIQSRFETLRLDPANWRLGLVYVCADDPRVVVRQRRGLGWTWNFGHRWVVPAIGIAILLFVLPPILAWSFGVRSPATLAIIAASSLAVLVLIASRLSIPPDD